MNGKRAGREWSADDGMGSFELWRLGNWSFELGTSSDVLALWPADVAQTGSRRCCYSACRT